jgi:hypothetical protein
MFRNSSYVHHQELFTVHSAMVYVIQICRQVSSSSIRIELQFPPDPGRGCIDLAQIRGKWWTVVNVVMKLFGLRKMGGGFLDQLRG